MMKNLQNSKTVFLIALFLTVISGQLLAIEGSGVYAGGVWYRNRDVTIPEIRESGFKWICVWTIHINKNGDLNLNGEFPLVKDGVYIGAETYPHFANDMELVKTAPTSVEWVEFGLSGWASPTFDNIRTFVEKEGVGQESTLYKSFKALKEAIPAIDAISFDDESTYHLGSATDFAIMLADLGFKVSLCPYTKKDFWSGLESNVNERRPGTIEDVHLQCYAGGANNDPCEWEGYFSPDINLMPGIEDAPAEFISSTMSSWNNSCEIKGGWLWLYAHFYGDLPLVQSYADAINSNISPQAIPDKTQLDLVKYVDTRIGTKPWSGKSELPGGEKPEGHTYPGVCLPFAKVEWTPQTSKGAIPYWYDDPAIQGFRASHYASGAVVSEYASFTLMPMTDDRKTDPKSRGSSFSHNTETASPNYYSVFLDDYQVKAELAGTSTSGIMRFTYPKSKQSSIVLDFFRGKGEVEVDEANNEISGYSSARGLGAHKSFKGYFVVKLDKKFDSYEIVEDGDNGKILRVSFKTKKDEIVKARVGTSFISIEQARENLGLEIPNWDFDQVVEDGEQVWNEQLNKIVVEGKEEDKIIFYTAMYHSLLLPRQTDEHGQYYSFYDGKVHEGYSYTDFSLWDTFRAEHPLLIFLNPDKVNEMIQSLLNTYDEGGWIPKWPNPGYASIMMGTHGDAVIADAFIKGVRGYDVEKAYEAMEKNANQKAIGDGYQARVGIEDYIKYGFVPRDKHGESVVRTLEFAIDDFCIAQMAKRMGKKEDYEKYITRAGFYKNVLDPESQLIRARYFNGTWVPEDDLFISRWTGNTKERFKMYRWNNTFLVPHDVEGLVEFFGSKDKFSSTLDTLFMKGYYYVGDEFSMHAPYLYNNVAKPWKTQKLLSEILSEYFTPEPDGLSGNDDCGQLSSWYIFGAMGFYPVAPGDPKYNIGSPVFDKVTLSLPNGRQFSITTSNNSDENAYIQSASFNGEDYLKSFIRHWDIMKGGNLHFEMGNTPNKDWGSKEGDYPVSSIETVDWEPALLIPYVNAPNSSFYDSVEVEIGHYLDDVQLYYTLDGSEPTKEDMLYNEPFMIKESLDLKVRAFKGEMEPSDILTVDFHSLPKGRSVEVLTNYHGKYTAGGDFGLIDHKKGNEVFTCGQYQGYEVEDMEAIISLGKSEYVNQIVVGTLQHPGNWIFYPKSIEVLVSDDGETFTPAGSTTYDLTVRQKVQSERKEFTIAVGKEARYLKVIARNNVKVPAWHDFAGNKAWVFVDEITIE